MSGIKESTVVDTGPLVALFSRTDQHQHWARADACLVRMTELNAHSRVMTTDSDFRIYRRNRRQVIRLLAPPAILRS